MVKIEAIGRELAVDNAVRHNAIGLIVMPGGVDVQIHMKNVQSSAITGDPFTSDTKSAAFGETTTIIDFAL
ncbi:MAG: hypothetical protein HC916_11830 [Coleofasciculaceae cyanobacterium SM2_1_6]|nr:hypothetical protein [Coleofasciculaceae cyanobacterium SM2_1_6]